MLPGSAVPPGLSPRSDFQPGDESPGYYRMSLRDNATVDRPRSIGNRSLHIILRSPRLNLPKLHPLKRRITVRQIKHLQHARQK